MMKEIWLHRERKKLEEEATIWAKLGISYLTICLLAELVNMANGFLFRAIDLVIGEAIWIGLRLNFKSGGKSLMGEWRRS
jgi:hypothetical protein